MAFKRPDQIVVAGTASGDAKAHLSRDKYLVGGFLAGAFIAFGGLLAITVSAGLDPKVWGTLPTLFTGAAFSLGLILVVVAVRAADGEHGVGAAGGDAAADRFAADEREPGVGDDRQPRRLAVRRVFLGGQDGRGDGGVVPLARLGQIAEAKGHTETDLQIFLRGVGCNWLVCLAVWMSMAAEDVSGKILAIFFPIMAFVAMGFDPRGGQHVLLAGGDLRRRAWHHVGRRAAQLGVRGLGNLVGAVVFVAGFYWYVRA